MIKPIEKYVFHQVFSNFFFNILSTDNKEFMNVTIWDFCNGGGE